MFFKFFLFTSNTLIVFFNWVYFSQLKIVIDIHRIWSPRRLVKIWSFKNLTEIVFRVIATSHDILSPKSIKAFEDDDDAINQGRKRLFRNLQKTAFLKPIQVQVSTQLKYFPLTNLHR